MTVENQTGGGTDAVGKVLEYLGKSALVASGEVAGSGTISNIKYRRYADGYLVQWGTIFWKDGDQIVTFPFAYRDESYALVGGLIPGDPTKSYEQMNFKDFKTTGFTFFTHDGYGVVWQASGYAEGT